MKKPHINFDGLDTVIVQKITRYFSNVDEGIFEIRCIFQRRENDTAACLACPSNAANNAMCKQFAEDIKHRIISTNSAVITHKDLVELYQCALQKCDMYQFSQIGNKAVKTASLFFDLERQSDSPVSYLFTPAQYSERLDYY